MNSDQERAAAILRSVHHALITANQEAHNLDATDRWQTLIEVAIDQAYRLMTGRDIDPVS